MNFIDLPPLLSARGTVRLPGSRSISSRVLLLASLALSDGSYTLSGVPRMHERLIADLVDAL
jgi:5-enolpyruvylshikimate-3-phosphate synthase